MKQCQYCYRVVVNLMIVYNIDICGQIYFEDENIWYAVQLLCNISSIGVISIFPRGFFSWSLAQ